MSDSKTKNTFPPWMPITFKGTMAEYWLTVFNPKIVEYALTVYTTAGPHGILKEVVSDARFTEIRGAQAGGQHNPPPAPADEPDAAPAAPHARWVRMVTEHRDYQKILAEFYAEYAAQVLNHDQTATELKGDNEFLPYHDAKTLHEAMMDLYGKVDRKVMKKHRDDFKTIFDPAATTMLQHITNANKQLIALKAAGHPLADDLQVEGLESSVMDSVVGKDYNVAHTLWLSKYPTTDVQNFKNLSAAFKTAAEQIHEASTAGTHGYAAAITNDSVVLQSFMATVLQRLDSMEAKQCNVANAVATTQPNNKAALAYCHTHGYCHNLNHTSMSCTHPGDHHDKTATDPGKSGCRDTFKPRGRSK